MYTQVTLTTCTVIINLKIKHVFEIFEEKVLKMGHSTIQID